MESDCVGEGHGDTHPMPSVFLVVWCLVPVGHEEKRLDKSKSVGFIVEVIQSLGENETVSTLFAEMGKVTDR